MNLDVFELIFIKKLFYKVLHCIRCHLVKKNGKTIIRIRFFELPLVKKRHKLHIIDK